MFKTIKRIIFSSLSILLISFVLWILFLLNPSLSYANSTQFDIVTVYHNEDLEEQTGTVVRNAITIVSKAELFYDDVKIDLCMNDDKLYPKLNPFVGEPTAYALHDKVVFKNCKPIFNENVAEFQWEVNNYELRKFNLTWLMAHEFTHNLQYQANRGYVFKSTLSGINWKLEGHAEYIARGFKNDGELKSKIAKYVVEEAREHTGLPVFALEDGTKQILSYYKYALIIQYLMEEKSLNFQQVCELDAALESAYAEMIEWNEE